MTGEEAIEVLKLVEENASCDDCLYYAQMEDCPADEVCIIVQAVRMAIQALSQEPCELLIIKSNILLHQDDRKKWAESIKREKESGVIILPPYFEPLLVPAGIEINTDCGAKMESEDKG